MRPYFVTFAGHRRIERFAEVEARLTHTLRELIESRRELEFLVGLEGDFDLMAASAVRRLRRELAREDVGLTLVLPYVKAGLELMERSFDSVELPAKLEGLHPKRAIVERNRILVRRASLIIAHVSRPYGGAFATLEYAERLGREVRRI